MPVIVAYHSPGQMGNYQTHPADDTADSHSSCGNQRGTEDHSRPEPSGIDTHGAGFFIAQGQQIDPPAQQKQRRKAQKHRNQRKPYIFGRCSVETAHEPVGDGRQLGFSVSCELYEGYESREQRSYHDAREHYVAESASVSAGAREPRERYSKASHCESRQLYPYKIEAQQYPEGGAESRAACHAQRVRCRERIREEALERASGYREAGAHEGGQQRDLKKLFPQAYKSDFKLKNAFRRAGRFSMPALRKSLELLAAADTKLKSTSEDHRTVFEKLMIELALARRQKA